jgi:hypothetical protein
MRKSRSKGTRKIRHTLLPRGETPWMRYAGLVESGNARSNRTVDEVVYGAKSGPLPSKAPHR